MPIWWHRRSYSAAPPSLKGDETLTQGRWDPHSREMRPSLKGDETLTQGRWDPHSREMRHFGRACGSHFINPMFLVSSHKTVFFSIRQVCGLRHLLLINDFKMYSNEKSLFWLGNETLSLVLAPVSKAVILPSPYSKKPFLDLSSLHCLETNITQKLAHCIRSAASRSVTQKVFGNNFSEPEGR